ncbi:MAG: type II secretion system F family protein [Coriobacteriia bacterium]|nr:type II secretion system F family protein [Coriobacteriia bacterium]
MAVYKYKGTSPAGQPVEGVVEAFDRFEALEKARQVCRVVSSVTEAREAPSFLKADLGSGKIDLKQLSIMCSQFAIIIEAGMNMSKCTQLVANQTQDKRLKAILEEVANDVASGHSMATSFEKRGGKKLPVLFYETLRAGELSGNLEESFRTLQHYYEKTSKTKAKLIGAIGYPCFVIMIAIVVVIVMMVAVVPTFKDILDSTGSEMPLMTQILIDVSNFFQQWWIVMLLVVLVLVVAFRLFIKTEKGRDWWARVKLKMPLAGNIACLSNAATFANTMATLVKSGLPVTQCVDITSRVLTNFAMAQATEKCVAKLEEGKRLVDCMRTIPGMPDTLVEMVGIGEESGELEATLETMGSFYDDETERATQSVISKIEPASLIFIALFAGYIVIALYVSMFSMYSGM